MDDKLCSLYKMEEERDISQSKEDNMEDNKTKEIKVLRRWISWIMKPNGNWKRKCQQKDNRTTVED